MLDKPSMNCIFLLGLFGTVGVESLKELGVSKAVLSKLSKDDFIFKDSIIINHQTITIYYLINKGKSIFNKYYTHFDIGNSRSKVHDYIHCTNVLRYINSIDDLYSYTNEKKIRNNYNDKIKECEKALGIKISCPDCSIVVNGKKIFIETLITSSKPKTLAKNNFKFVMEEEAELLILR